LEIDPNTAEFATAATRWFRKAIELNEKLGSRLRQRRFRTSDGGLTFSEEVLFPALVQALSAGVPSRCGTCCTTGCTSSG